jgi:conjugative relaxase-like TrwC/TraI family protein
MLRITQQASAANAKGYYAAADYYSEGQELVGLWGGKGAERLGLSGTVDRAAFDRLCDNLHPATGQPLTARHRTDRTVGYDFTFSAPKSVSLLYALTGDEDLLAAFRAAVDDTMREIEAEMKTRVRTAGREEDRTTGNMVWAEFVHTTARPVGGVPDPQLHAHVFAFNATYDGDEDRWKAGQFRELKRDAPYFQAAFRARLANRIQDVGYGVERKRDDFELAGVPTDLLKRFSRRTAVIEKVAAEKGILDPDRKAELGAETRERKEKSLGWSALKKEWDSRLSDAERARLASVHRREVPSVRLREAEQLAVDHAVAHVFTRDAVAPDRKLLTEALKRGVGSVTVEATARELAGRTLVRKTVDGREMATTKEMLALESRLIDFARDGRGRFRPLGDPDRPISREWLNAGQRSAVRHALGSRDRVILIRGAAGTGKTTLEQEIGEALAAAGKPVVALAPSAQASRGVLRTEAGFAAADTVARFLVDREMQASARDGVILVDEAGLLGTRDTATLFDIAESVNARVLLVGDRRQHRSVSAGEPLKLLEERAGLRPAQVTDILRQTGEYRAAAKALSEGQVAEAFGRLDRLGWVEEVASEERYRVLADAYLATVEERSASGTPKSALVVSPTHAEAARITEAIRAGLRDRGKLGGERVVTGWVAAHLTDAQKADPTEYDPGMMIQYQQNAPGVRKGTRVTVTAGSTPPAGNTARYEVYRPADLLVAVGDRVRVTAGGKTKDGKHRLNTGAVYTVAGFTARGDIVVDHGWVIDRDFGHLTHGYVVTSHASQGTTVDRVFVGIATESLPATGERTAYVSLTRGKEQVRVFTDDKSALLAAVGRPDDPLTATELAEPLPSSRIGFNRSRTGVGRGTNERDTTPQPEVSRDR